MMKKSAVKTGGAEKVRWDLSFMYSGLDDPKLAKDVDEWCRRAEKFYADHHGKLAVTLGSAIRDMQALSALGMKTGVYLFLRSSTNTGDSAVKAKQAEIERRTSALSGEKLNFFRHELVALDDKVIKSLAAKDKTVKKHLPWVEGIRVFKQNFLPEIVESYFAKYSPFGTGAWSEFFDEFESDLRFRWKGKDATLTEMSHLMSKEKSAAVRAKAMKVMNDGLAGHFAKYSAQTLWMTAGEHSVDVRERKYAHPMESRNKESRIPDAVVNALHSAVREYGAPLAQRFYRLKGAHLGIKKLRWSDRNAPMPFSDESVVPYAEAQKLVLEAYASFSPTLAAIVRDTVKAKRIDAPATASKRGGAYNYSLCLPDGTPVSFTFLNYIGSNRDVMTLAHELGHGVHGILAGQAQGVLMQHAPMAFCETASVFGEKTTFNFLRQRAAKKGDLKSRLALVMGKLDDIMNTVVRQISFSEFERGLHGWDHESGKWTVPAKRSVEELDALWIKTTKMFYGEEGEVFTYKDMNHLWAYISHFHRPFYVYSYAFGELLTHSLYARQSELGDRFEPLYLDMLRSGDTLDVVQLTKPFGLDPTHPDFWAKGIKVGIQDLLEEAEELSRQMKVIK